MQIYIDENVKFKHGTALTIGNFDGLHIGHKHLINIMKLSAKENDLETGVFTFYKHTLNTLNEERNQKILVSNEKKIDLIKKMDLDFLYMITFDERVRKSSPKQFVENYLVKQLNVKLVVVGVDFKFGAEGSGDTIFLKELGNEYGFEVIVVDPLMYDDIIVSSTVIRNMIADGLISNANEFLDRPYCITGKVTKGKSRGKGLGFPTANIQTTVNYVLPKSGVYMTITKINNKEFLSATSIGKNPTFEDDNNITIESHILDFYEDIYDDDIEVSFLEFIRDEKKFVTEEELVKQISKDIDIIKNKKLFTLKR